MRFSVIFGLNLLKRSDKHQVSEADDDDDHDEWYLWYGWPMKGI